MLNRILERLGLRPRPLTEDEQRRSDEFFDRTLADWRADEIDRRPDTRGDGSTNAE